ncbi:class I SAM-dependent methyltransferase [Sulfurimonas sp. HSL3-7]|uniref:class I SAM-dependent methyltransferase n=1 Tax=Sulfonitrofixus jiaomeiensis TaxID=3131938 RepID=UPI0031F7D876
MNSTLAYYADHAQDFFDNTHGKEMTEIYERFLPLLPVGAAILDAGCGSGRDTRYFLSQGFMVDAFDASDEMATLASEFIGQPVAVHAFCDVDKYENYHAVWAAASLLHLPFSELPDTFQHLAGTLKKGGYFYASFKYGREEYLKEGRHFTQMDHRKVDKLFAQLPSLSIQSVWLSDDVRQERKGEKWLNLLAKKESRDND